MSIPMIAAIAGIVLIVAGIGLVAYQMVGPGGFTGAVPVQLNKQGVKIETGLPGIAMIGIGGFLLIVSMGAAAVSALSN
jgi:hypothetical protein